MDTEHGSGIDEEQAWQAVLARDAREDGRLYYGVASTGVYCRPACPARRPRRSGVRFFATPEAAERAGFRACRRCRPKEAPASAALVRRVCAHLEARATDGAFGPATLAELARVTGTSAFHLQRVFTRATGISPREYAAALRSARFRERLAAGDAIADAVYAAGFG